MPGVGRALEGQPLAAVAQPLAHRVHAAVRTDPGQRGARTPVPAEHAAGDREPSAHARDAHAEHLAAVEHIRPFDRSAAAEPAELLFVSLMLGDGGIAELSESFPKTILQREKDL